MSHSIWPNLNGQCDSNSLNLFRNGIIYCNITPIIVTWIAVDLFDGFWYFIRSFQNDVSPIASVLQKLSDFVKRLLKNSTLPHTADSKHLPHPHPLPSLI